MNIGGYNAVMTTDHIRASGPKLSELHNYGKLNQPGISF